MSLTKKDIIWGFTAQGLSIALWVVLLPVVLRYLSPVELGMWLVFNTIAGLAQLAELGFQPTLARNVSYLYAGAQDLVSTGMQSGPTGELNGPLLAAVHGASRKIYRIMTLLVAGILWLGGTVYLQSVIPAGVSRGEILTAWFLFSAGYIVNFYFGYLTSFLQGRGDMIQANKVVTASKVSQLFISVALVMGKGGLVGLGLASLLSTLVSRFLAYHYVFGRDHAEMRQPKAPPGEVHRICKVIWHNSGRYGLVLVGAFLITRANILIAASKLGVAQSASYVLALQMFIVIQTMATLPFNLVLPQLNMCRAQGRGPDLLRVFSTSVALALILFLAGGTALVLGGAPVLRLLRSRTILPPTPLLAGMAVVFLLELNHGICANFIATGNQVPFVRAALVTGACIVAGSWILARPLGVAGLLLSTAFCQVCYNNWKWPVEAARILGLSYYKVILNGFLKAKYLFA